MLKEHLLPSSRDLQNLLGMVECVFDFSHQIRGISGLEKEERFFVEIILNP